MSKKDRFSRDQRRKAKLKKRAQRSPKRESLAYAGGKYKTAEYVMILLKTETGIYESYVISDRTLTDSSVEAALESMIIRMRQRALPSLSEFDDASIRDDSGGDLVVWNILRNWKYVAEQQQLPVRDELIGILRTILHSLEIWRSESLHSRGYLHYLEGFLKQAGVSVRRVTEDLEVIDDESDDALLELGRAWIVNGDADAEEEFGKAVEDLLEDGDAEYVIEICQQLLGETEDTSVVPLLQALAMRGHLAVKNQIR